MHSSKESIRKIHMSLFLSDFMSSKDRVMASKEKRGMLNGWVPKSISSNMMGGEFQSVGSR